MWEESGPNCYKLRAEKIARYPSNAEQTHGRTTDSDLSVARPRILQLHARGCDQGEDGGRARQGQAAAGEGGRQQLGLVWEVQCIRLPFGSPRYETFYVLTFKFS